MAEEIIDRLKAEGQLIRNTGTNSIRAVRIQLDRFENIFETISENITQQTQMMAAALDVSNEQLRINQETAEREEARRQRDELLADQRPQPTREDLPNKVSKKEKEGLFSMLAGFGLSKLLLAGVGVTAFGFAAYNILKGFIDEKTGGKFSEFEDKLIDTVKNIDFDKIKENFKLMADSLVNISKKLQEIYESIKDMNFPELSLDSIIRGTSFAVVSRAILKSPLPPHLKVLGLVVAAAMFGEDGSGSADTQVERRENRQGNYAQPGSPEYEDELNRRSRGRGGRRAPTTAPQPNNEQQTLEEIRAEIYKLENELTELETDSNNLTTEIYQNKLKELKKLNGALRELLDPDPDAISIKPVGTPSAEPPAERLTQNVDEAFERFMKIEKYLNNNPDILPMAKIKLVNDQTRLLQEYPSGELAKKVLQHRAAPDGLQEFKRGTKGFQDFGNASFAILHGREAVIPEETPAGRFLNQFFTDNWTPKMSKISSVPERAAMAASGAINMPVIVNNSPTVAPVINNVQGGPNVTNTNMFGHGGGDRARNTYGIPSAGN